MGLSFSRIVCPEPRCCCQLNLHGPEKVDDMFELIGTYLVFTAALVVYGAQV